MARLVGEGTRLTGTGTQVGTPYYMAPEAWEGQALDAQADIWALGVVLYGNWGAYRRLLETSLVGRARVAGGSGEAKGR